MSVFANVLFSFLSVTVFIKHFSFDVSLGNVLLLKVLCVDLFIYLEHR